MPINDPLTQFFGLPIREFDQEAGLESPAAHAWKVAISYDEADEGVTVAKRIEALVAKPGVNEIRALVIGTWSYDMGADSSEIVAALVNAAPKLPNLRAIFLGDITFEEQEISWIQQSDVTPVLKAYPALEVFRVRGSDGLKLKSIQHRNLRELAFETGGLDAEVARAAIACELPALEHFEIWTGDGDYGNTCTLEDFQTLLAGVRFPKLKRLGMRNTDFTDALAEVLPNAPVVRQLQVLDLSLGTLSDKGGKALLDGAESFRRLELLDLHHHYLSEGMQAALRETGLPLNLDDPQEGDEDDGEIYRYVAVGE